MAHNRNDSLDPLSSLISISSRASVENYESLRKEITSVEQSQIDLPELVDAAEKIIKEKFAPSDPQSTYTYKKGSETISVKLDAVMSTMLACAEECGGDRGKRYVASAIVACGQKGDDGVVVQALAALGTTWLTHLLFIFKTCRSHETQPNQQPATPTLQSTTSHGGEGVGLGHASFQEDVIMRDGWTCVLTGFQDPSHPAPNKNISRVYLQASHILCRAIGKFDKNPKSDWFKSAVTTFDILVNFTRLPVQTLEELHNYIDDASNGMMLERNAHDAFDRFSWCLKKTETDNVYTLTIFEETGILGTPENNLVTFRDKSDDFSLGSTRKRNRTTPLPNPHYIAIHAAIAGILHMSGAGKFFDELLDKYKDGEGEVPPVQSWSELEEVMLERVLTESVAESLQSVQVY